MLMFGYLAAKTVNG